MLPVQTVPAQELGSGARPARAVDAPPREGFLFAQALVGSRRNVSPKRLVDPGPDDAQLNDLLDMAAAAPDHGRLTPWRFVLVPASVRHRLAEVFASALLDRDPGADPPQVEAAKEKAHRAPLLLIAIACLGPREPDIPPLERMVSMGAAIQNLILGAHAMGYGTGLTSGKAMASPRLADLLHLSAGEFPVCCINIGSVASRRTSPCERPSPTAILSVLR